MLSTANVTYSLHVTWRVVLVVGNEQLTLVGLGGLVSVPKNEIFSL